MKDLEQFTTDKIKHLTMAIDQSAFTAIRDRLIEEKAMAEIALKSIQARPVGYLFVSPDGGIAYSISNVEFEGVKLVGAVYDFPPVNSQDTPHGWKLVPIDPTDEQLRLMLAARYPATFREHLRNPLNGHKSRVEAEILIIEVTNQYRNALSAAPNPE